MQYLKDTLFSFQSLVFICIHKPLAIICWIPPTSDFTPATDRTNSIFQDEHFFFEIRNKANINMISLRISHSLEIKAKSVCSLMMALRQGNEII